MSAAPFRVDVLTLFPQMLEAPLRESLLGKARERRLIDVNVLNLRDWAEGLHKQADDKPFGGGCGMVLKIEPIFRAFLSLGLVTKSGRKSAKKNKPYVVYLSPQGQRLEQNTVQSLARHNRLVLLCGHYEGIDQRAMAWVDQEISIGDYVLTGGELPALVVIDTIARYIPGVVKEAQSVEQDSFSQGMLDCDHYTRPQTFLGESVPSVLLSGDHKKIAQWRQESAKRNTINKRPDLIDGTKK